MMLAITRTAHLFILMAFGMIFHALDIHMDLFVNLVSTYVNAKAWVATFFLRRTSRSRFAHTSVHQHMDAFFFFPT